MFDTWMLVAYSDIKWDNILETIERKNHKTKGSDHSCIIVLMFPLNNNYRQSHCPLRIWWCNHLHTYMCAARARWVNYSPSKSKVLLALFKLKRRRFFPPGACKAEEKLCGACHHLSIQANLSCLVCENPNLVCIPSLTTKVSFQVVVLIFVVCTLFWRTPREEEEVESTRRMVCMERMPEVDSGARFTEMCFLSFDSIFTRTHSPCENKKHLSKFCVVHGIHSFPFAVAFWHSACKTVGLMLWTCSLLFQILVMLHICYFEVMVNRVVFNCKYFVFTLATFHGASWPCLPFPCTFPCVGSHSMAKKSRFWSLIFFWRWHWEIQKEIRPQRDLSFVQPPELNLDFTNKWKRALSPCLWGGFQCCMWNYMFSAAIEPSHQPCLKLRVVVTCMFCWLSWWINEPADW